MTEKIIEYAAEGADWPLAANILDPVRFVCLVACMRLVSVDPSGSSHRPTASLKLFHTRLRAFSCAC
jgi:hypothetical protein